MAATSHDVFDAAPARRRERATAYSGAADVAAMRVGINVQRCAVAPPTWRRANERRRRAMSPMTSVATSSDGVAGTAPAGSAGDVWRCRRVRVRRRAVGQPPRGARTSGDAE